MIYVSRLVYATQPSCTGRSVYPEYTNIIIISKLCCACRKSKSVMVIVMHVKKS